MVKYVVVKLEVKVERKVDGLIMEGEEVIGLEELVMYYMSE